MTARLFGITAVAAALALGGGTACTTEAFCFSDCEGSSNVNPEAGIEDQQLTDTPFINPDAGDACIGLFCGMPDARTDGAECMPTNGGMEICDGLDNDCNGTIDDGIDFTRPENCGNCGVNCTIDLQNVLVPECNPPTPPDGTTPGTCDYTDCASDFYDRDGNRENGCEYFCPFNPNGTNTTDPGGADGCGKDDDCDTEIDEDVNTCDDVENCGKCGKRCVLANATAKCTTTATGTEKCVEANTSCEIDQCDLGFGNADGAHANGCEYQCPVFPPTAEVCNGLDDDCDGRIDNNDQDLLANDPDVGDSCFGGTAGECAAANHEGVKKCIGGLVTCCDKSSGDTGAALLNKECSGAAPPFVLRPGDLPETCNNKDDDCDNLVDDNPIDAGGTCGSSVGSCRAGTQQCVTGALSCVGAAGPQPDLCNGADDNCDGVIDGTVPTGGAPVSCNSDTDCSMGRVCRQRTGPTDKVCVNLPTDAVGPCGVPPAPPAGATTPCRGGTLTCAGGVAQCIGSIGPQSSTDLCGDDTNCDGALTSQPNLTTDVRNCGACGNDCNALAPGGHGQWACQAGACVRTGCEFGFINCDGNMNDCERSCTFTSATELCNGVDDNCNCTTDETTGPGAIALPTPEQVCGVTTGATDCGCRANGASGCPPNSGVGIQCTGGLWQCTFPANFCSGTAPDYCLGQADPCDGRDNNCNGNTDESFKPPVLVSTGLGQPCNSSGSGACITQGTYVCNGAGTGTQCNASPVACATLPGGCTEVCDGKDNDCDGSIDEPKSSPGTNAANFVAPSVVSLNSAPNVWMYAYEASRPTATTTTPGSGNGWQTSAPAGTALERTQACSVTNRIPWFNAQPPEAAQVCVARGGRLCTVTDWTRGCQTTAGTPCTRGYNPRGAACTSNQTGAKFCNIGPFDFNTTLGGNQDGLLPTASALLQNCWADWSGTTGNTTVNQIRDIMGNLREITFNPGASAGGCTQTTPGNSQCVYTLMGGAFNTESEDGAACNFTFFSVNSNFRLFDTGFRCCFDTNPV